jgi:putative ABC transport system permease protein
MTYPRLVLRNLMRHPLRTLFTTLSIALSIFLVCAVLTLPTALDAIFERSASNVRLTIHHKAGLTYWLPYAFVQRVRGIPGVAGINHYSWFGGVYDEPKNMFPNFGVDPETIAEVWPDYGIDPVALERFKRVRNGALVGADTFQKFGWHIGQEVTLRGTIFPVDLTFQILGVIP